jgi:hypothetical protein
VISQAGWARRSQSAPDSPGEGRSTPGELSEEVHRHQSRRISARRWRPCHDGDVNREFAGDGELAEKTGRTIVFPRAEMRDLDSMESP